MPAVIIILQMIQ